MRRIETSILVLLVLSVLGPGLARAEDPASREMLWEGYLYAGENGRVQLGWPVVAMGVMAEPSHVVTGDLAKTLAPLVSPADGSFVFWNYRLEREGPKALEGLPRALVKLKGRVEHVGDQDPNVFSSTAGERHLKDGRLVGVEFVSEAWLLHWATFFRPKGSPFRIRQEEKMKGEALAAFTRKARDTLQAMRGLPGATDEQRALVRKIDARARVLETFRRRQESHLLRWLRQANEDQALGLDLEALGKPMPTGFELQRLFLEAPDKKAFLAKVAAIWSGDLELVELPYYDRDASSAWYALVDLKTLRDDWTEDDYRRYLEITTGMVGSLMRELGAAFLAGVGVMALELLASRWLAPSFGFTLTTWAFLISATLLAGTIGAAWGGRLSSPTRPNATGLCLAGAGLAFLLCAWFGPWWVDRLATWPLHAGAALAAAALVMPAVILLGAILPLAAEARGRGAASGSTVGGLVAASTFGSLVGTLATALWWLPDLGLRATACVLAGVLWLAAAGALRVSRARVASRTALALALGACGLAFVGRTDGDAHRLIRESPYGTLVLEHRGAAGRLTLDGILQGTVEPGGASSLLATDLYVGLLPWLHPRGRRALLIGLGTGRTSRILEPRGIEVTTVEVNPVLVDLIRSRVGHDGRVLVGDGRAVWRRLDERFDFVLLDAFQGEGLPGHLVTVEAFGELRAKLTSGGILHVHLIGRPSHPLTAAVRRTVGAVFPHVLALRTGAAEELQDVILLASDAPLRVPPDPALAARGWTGGEPFESKLDGAALLTDDLDPVDRLNEPLAQALRQRSRRPESR